jgi:hypothetical protein
MPMPPFCNGHQYRHLVGCVGTIEGKVAQSGEGGGAADRG